MQRLSTGKTAVTVVFIAHLCTAQLFPWTNLKTYFDQKTKNGPGNDGTLNVVPLLTKQNIDDTNLDGIRPYRNVDNTDISSYAFNNKPSHSTVTPVSATTIKDITKEILKLNKNNNHKINFSFDNHHTNQQYSHLEPIISINLDSTIRPQIKTNDKKQSQINDDSQNHEMIVITQKPSLNPSHNYDSISNKKVSHKTVSILPSIDSYVENAQRPVYVTSRPFGYYDGKLQDDLNDFSAVVTHRPIKEKKPADEYSKADTLTFLPTVLPNMINKPAESVNIQKSDIHDINKHKGNLYIETVPSLGISIKSSGDKPFRITDDTNRILDYLVPPPIPRDSRIKSQHLQSIVEYSPINGRIYGSKRIPVQYQSIPTDSLSETNKPSISYNIEPNDYPLIKEMSKLKPPVDEKNAYLENGQKEISDNNISTNLENYLVLLKQQELLARRRNQAQQLANPSTNRKRTKTRRKSQRLVRLNKENDKEPKIDKYNDHRPPVVRNIKETENNYKVPNSPASDFNEQIASETGFTGPHTNDGDRVEFQMHGQNGPNSYKFGFDTGKGDNRQFRYEERNKDGYVKGHYGYYDKEGKLNVVNYEADPKKGFKADNAPV